MQELNRVFSIVKSYIQKAHSKGFVSFESLSTEAGISREVLKEYLEELKKMKLITYSATGTCYLLLTKSGIETDNIPSKPDKQNK
jgi:DNA-binding IscR family transcriptional regulator